MAQYCKSTINQLYFKLKKNFNKIKSFFSPWLQLNFGYKGKNSNSLTTPTTSLRCRNCSPQNHVGAEVQSGWQGAGREVIAAGHPAGGSLPAGGTNKLSSLKGAHGSPWLSQVHRSQKAKPTVAAVLWGRGTSRPDGSGLHPGLLTHSMPSAPP